MAVRPPSIDILNDESSLAERCQEDWYSYFLKKEKGGRPLLRLNHGSFGAAPRPVLAAAEEFRRRWLEQPDEVYFDVLPTTLWSNACQVAELLGAKDPHQIALVDNSTTAVASVAHSVAWQLMTDKKNDDDNLQPAALFFSTTYAAVANCLEATLKRAGCALRVVDTPFPVSSVDEVIERYQSTLLDCVASFNVVLIVIDHISSCPTIVMPIQQMIALARQAAPAAKIFIDGAHAVGQVPVDLGLLDADFYCSNLHKWALAPTGAAILYARDAVSLPEGSSFKLHNPFISHNYGQGITRECMWTGTRDMSSLLSVGASLDFISSIGGLDAIARRNNRVLLQGRELLMSAWKTDAVTPPELCASMAMVALPDALRFSDTHGASDAYRLRKLLREHYNIEVIVLSIASRGFLRVSCQIYNRIEDFQALSDAILDVIAQGRFASQEALAFTDPHTAPPGPLV